MQQTQNFFIGMNQIINHNGPVIENKISQQNQQELFSKTMNNILKPQNKKNNLQTASSYSKNFLNQTQHLRSEDTQFQINLTSTQKDFIKRCFGYNRSPKLVDKPGL